MESDLLDSVIGVVFVWFLLSTVLSVLNEGFALLTRTRAKHLWLGIGNLIEPDRGQMSAGLVDTAMRLPFRGRHDPRPLTGMAPGSRAERRARRRERRASPEMREVRARNQALYAELAPQVKDVARRGRLSKATNVPPDAFAEAVISLATRVGTDDVLAAARDAGWVGLRHERLEQALRARSGSALQPDDVAGLAGVGNLATTDELADLYRRAMAMASGRDVAAYFRDNPELARAVRRAAASVGADERLASVRRTVESWFDREMQQLSAFYRRQSRKVLAILAVPLVILTHANAIALFEDLRRDASLRQAVTNAAVATAAEESVGDAIAAGCPATATTAAGAGDPRATSTTLAGTTTTSNPVDQATRQFRCASRILERATSFRVGLAWQELIGSDDDGDDGRLEPGDLWPYLKQAVARDWGWVGRSITLVALLFGAQFWFDLLRRLTGLRSPAGRASATSGAGPTA